MMLRSTMPELADVAKGDHERRLVQLAAVLAAGVAEGALRSGLDAARDAPLLYGPLLFAALLGDTAELLTVADDVVTQFLAAHRRA